MSPPPPHQHLRSPDQTVFEDPISLTVEENQMETVTKVLSLLISWPMAVLVLAFVFRRQIKGLTDFVTTRTASLKLPGNFEFSIKELEQQGPQSDGPQEQAKFSDALAKVVSRLPEKSPEAIKTELDRVIRDNRAAGLNLFLKTVSYQLVAWLHAHRTGEPFGLADLLTEERIPIEHAGRKAGAYCLHCAYEKEAPAAEFRRNFWNLRRFGVIEPVNDTQVRVLAREPLESAMEEVVSTERELHDVSAFVDKFLRDPKGTTPRMAETLKKAPALPDGQKPESGAHAS